MNQIDKAIYSIEEGEKYNPTEAGFYVLMSDLYLVQKSYEKAKSAIQKALKISPEDESIMLKADSIEKQERV